MNMDRKFDSNTNWHILIAGLPSIPQDLELAPGIILKPLSEPLSVFDLAAVGTVGFRNWALLEPFAAACTCEIESSQNETIAPGYNTLNRAWLASSLLVLRGYTRHISLACSNYSWSQIAGYSQISSEESKSRLPGFQGGILDFHLNTVCNSGTRENAISSEDILWISTRFNTFNMLAANSDSFRFALESSIDWRFTKDGRAAIARLWSGIEAIFGISSELVYRISLLSSSLLASRGEKRRNKFKQIKKLYSLRSKAVHGSKLSTKEMQLAINESFELLADLLIYSIEKGHALSQDDFDEAVFD